MVKFHCIFKLKLIVYEVVKSRRTNSEARRLIINCYNSVVFNYGIEKTNKKATSQRVIAFFTIFATWASSLVAECLSD